VDIENLSENSETISNLDGVVTLTANSLSNSCPNATVVLHAGAPNVDKPVLLKAKGQLKVYFDVTFSDSCGADAAYSYVATVNQLAIDGQADTDPANDTCPRPPNPATGDKGCTAVSTAVTVK
jgi:hypothetical protein